MVSHCTAAATALSNLDQEPRVHRAPKVSGSGGRRAIAFLSVSVLLWAAKWKPSPVPEEMLAFTVRAPLRRLELVKRVIHLQGTKAGASCPPSLGIPGLSSVAVCAASALATGLTSRLLKQRLGCPRALSVSRKATEQAYKVLVPVADDSEEIETACITDVLVRAGAEVVVASVGPNLQVRMSRGLKVVADVLISSCVGKQWDVIACPGGMPGAERLRDSKELTQLLKEHHASGRWTAAVCASPAVVFATHGLLPKTATSYPAPKFKELVGSGWTEAQAVVDGHVITSQGPGTSLQFALKIVEVLYGRAKAEELAAQMVTHAL